MVLFSIIPNVDCHISVLFLIGGYGNCEQNVIVTEMPRLVTL